MSGSLKSCNADGRGIHGFRTVWTGHTDRAIL